MYRVYQHIPCATFEKIEQLFFFELSQGTQLKTLLTLLYIILLESTFKKWQVRCGLFSLQAPKVES